MLKYLYTSFLKSCKKRTDFTTNFTMKMEKMTTKFNNYQYRNKTFITCFIDEQ